jgi:transcriptional regulator with XRE-family HTH domain
MGRANPTLRQRELGIRLRELRARSGLTVEKVAEQPECSSAKISWMETVARGSIPRDGRDLCHIYGVTRSGRDQRSMS